MKTILEKIKENSINECYGGRGSIDKFDMLKNMSKKELKDYLDDFKKDKINSRIIQYYEKNLKDFEKLKKDFTYCVDYICSEWGQNPEFAYIFDNTDDIKKIQLAHTLRELLNPNRGFNRC